VLGIKAALERRPRARSAGPAGSVVPDTSASSIARPDLPIMLGLRAWL
jgi:hypothetical protein